MKKVCTIMLVLSYVFIFQMSAIASTDTYQIKELDLSVSIPNIYTVFTRNTKSNDPNFADFGLKKGDLQTYFETNNIYLNAISNYFNEEIVVTMSTAESPISDLNLFSSTELNIWFSTLKEQYEAFGVSVSDMSIYNHYQAKFIKIYFNEVSTSTYGLQYYTIYNNRAMNFTLRSYSKEIKPIQETTMKTIIDSIEYNTLPKTIEKQEITKSFTYLDNDTGVTFEVPQNWVQHELSEEREVIDVSFISNEESGLMIFYGSREFLGRNPRT